MQGKNGKEVENKENKGRENMKQKILKINKGRRTILKVGEKL